MRNKKAQDVSEIRAAAKVVIWLTRCGPMHGNIGGTKDGSDA